MLWWECVILDKINGGMENSNYKIWKDRIPPYPPSLQPLYIFLYVYKLLLIIAKFKLKILYSIDRQTVVTDVNPKVRL